MADHISTDDLSVPVLDGRPYLGDLNVAARLAADFAQGVLKIRTDWQAGKEEARDAVGLTEALAARYGDIVMGRDSAYQPTDWTRRLGAKLRFLAPADLVARFPNAPETAFFIYVAQVVVASAMAIESGDMTEEAAAAELQETLDDVAARLVGVR